MADQKPPSGKIFGKDFVDISITVLKKIPKEMPFDIYIQRAAEKFTKLFPKGEQVEDQRFEEYSDKKGIKALFVHRDNYREYLLYVKSAADTAFKNPDAQESENLVHLLKEMVNLSIFEIVVSMNVDETSLNDAADTVRGCIDVLRKDPKSLIKLFVMLSKHPYVIRHSISASIFSLLLAKELKLESSRTLNAIGLGAFLHDIGMSRLPFDVEDKTDLTPEEWKQIKEHPQLGKRALDAVKALPSEVRMIVLQHHEQPNGSGYPDGLHSNEIYMPAKIVAIADSFAALVSKRPFREEACTPQKALALMEEERGKFDPEMLKTFKKIFIKTKK